MNAELMKKLWQISPEEQEYLEGKNEVRKEIYTLGRNFDIDPQLLLAQDRLVTVRPHSRFVDFPEHSHNYIEIMYVCHGSITHYIEGKALVMKQGDILFLNQYVKHRVKKAGYDDIGINFIALPEFFEVPLQMLHNNNMLAEFLINTLCKKNQISSYLLFSLEKNQAIENLMENMISSMVYNCENQDTLNQYSMGLVFLYLLEQMERVTKNSVCDYKEVIMQSIFHYVDTYYKTATLTKIAEDLHQSLSVLSKMIREKTGCTFQELLQRKRFQKAAMFLVETDLTVEEIATAVGYENYSYFYRRFKSKYKMTPKKYRTLHKGGSGIRI